MERKNIPYENACAASLAAGQRAELGVHASSPGSGGTNTARQAADAVGLAHLPVQPAPSPEDLEYKAEQERKSRLMPQEQLSPPVGRGAMPRDTVRPLPVG